MPLRSSRRQRSPEFKPRQASSEAGEAHFKVLAPGAGVVATLVVVVAGAGAVPAGIAQVTVVFWAGRRVALSPARRLITAALKLAGAASRQIIIKSAFMFASSENASLKCRHMFSSSFFLHIATFFGIGKLRPAPGTWGTLATVPIAWGLMNAGQFWHMAACVALLPIAVLVCEAHEKHFGTHDSSEVVVDEVLGFLVTMVWLPITWQSFLAGFILFRALDILKPFPISYLDRNVPGGVGAVADDLLAGLIANLILQIVYTQTHWLGLRLVGV